MTNSPDTATAESGKNTLSARTVSQILELIASRGLSPGDRLPTERELAQMLGVSRVTVRDALSTLAARGAVEARRGSGTFVAARGVEATIEELTTTLRTERDVFADLFAVRRLLEPAAAQWAANRAEPSQVESLQAIVAEMETIGRAKKPDLHRMADLDSQFHVEIAATGENGVMLHLMEAIQDLHREQLETSSRYRGRLADTVTDHRRIVDAIAAADPVGASLAMTDHLARSEAAHQSRLGF